MCAGDSNEHVVARIPAAPADSRGGHRTAAEMQMAKTFLEADWDFVGETANGTDDIWWILEGKDHPRLWWETHNN